ncbi:FACT complex subunit spt16 [Pichia californica]|uniref:FACT complex subunit n=1 Tax=Pichia californica TaxID=460514 RepID=A0A9P6WKZ2_9ASCO|nr:FACT complex subunit spt16 [[Candida] californica]
MSDIEIDPALFRRRLHLIQKNIFSNDAFQKVNGLLLVVGSSEESNPYQKSTVIHTWLLGYEFPATAIYITKQKIYFVTSISKAKYLQPLANNNNNIVIYSRNKDPEHNKIQFEKFFKEMESTISDSNNSIGIILKDKYQGKFMNEFNPLWDDFKTKLDLKDVSSGVSETLEFKDEEEQKNLRTAARASVNMMNYFTDEMSKIIDEDLNVSNSKLVEKIENKLDDGKFFKNMENNKSMKKLGKDFDLNNLDWCYKAIIQSNGKYELKFSVESTDDKLSGPIIMASLGLRYNNYCSNVSRTFLIAPSKEMEKNYEFLVSLQEYIFTILKDGIKFNEIYNKAIQFIEKNNPALKDLFVKNIGSLIGIDFRDSSAIINSRNENRILKENSVVNLVLGFNNIIDPEKGNYALLLSDTVRITGSEPIILTESPKLKKEIAFYFDDIKDEPSKTVKQEVKKEVKQEKSKDTKNSKSDPIAKIENYGNTRVLKAKRRSEQNNAEEGQTQIQKEIQSELHAKRQKEGLERFNPEDAKDGSDTRSVFKRYESYVRESQIPSNVKDLKIHIDSKNQTIIVPIMGRPVPFHINSYKNGSKTEEGDYTHLRLNFNSPGLMISKREELPYETGDDKQFIRSLTFRSKDGSRMTEVLKRISEMKKSAVKRESEKRERADVVSQASLIEVNRPKRLDNVFVRPTPDTKRFAGFVTIHQNGIRYQSLTRDQRVDVLFSNIKHLFFQSCKGELLVIIHAHLRTPIMIGKKKTYDVQFYREATDMSIDETGNRKRKYRYGDEDELEQEQEERRRRAHLDKEFRAFSEAIADTSNGLVDLDIPFRELGFQGVPSRSAVVCLPTRDCLVQLVDLPFLVVTLEEVEIAHLERVQFGLKNFDLVFVFKDFSRSVVHISTIPMESLEDVKAWLTDVDIPYSEGPVNLNWPTIMKTIQSDPYNFFQDGGWSFLGGDGDSDEEGDEESAESDFDPSDADPQDEEEYSEAEDDDDDVSMSEDDDGSVVSEDDDIADSDNLSEENFSD